MTRMLCQLFKKPQSLPDELSQLVKHELMLSSIASKMKTEFTKMHLLLLIFLVIKKLYFSKLRKSWSHKIVQFLPEADKIHSINPMFFSHLSAMMLMNDLIMGTCSWSPAIKFAHLIH